MNVVILLSALFIGAYLWVFIFHDKAMDAINRKGERTPSCCSKLQTSPSLGTTNGIGGAFFGYFRPSEASASNYVAYNFFSIFFLPIIPLGCYRIERGESTRINYKRSSRMYKIYGEEKSIGIEILSIYLDYYCTLIIIAVTLLSFHYIFFMK